MTKIKVYLHINSQGLQYTAKYKAGFFRWEYVVVESGACDGSTWITPYYFSTFEGLKSKLTQLYGSRYYIVGRKL